MLTPWRWIFGLCTAALLFAPIAQAAEDAEVFAAKEFRPFLKKYCAECHFGEDPDGEQRLDQARTPEELTAKRALYTKAAQLIGSGQMPPKDSPQPSAEVRKQMARWLDDTINYVDCSGPSDPGRETIHRLNRAEYSNTIRDLLSVEFDAKTTLPADDAGYGFDNIGDVLSVSPLLLEKYVDAARTVSRRAVIANPEDAVTTKWITGVAMRSGGRDHPLPEIGGRRLYSEVEVRGQYEAPKDGQYIVRIKAYGEQAGEQPVRMIVRVDGQKSKKFDVKATKNHVGWYEQTVEMKRGKREVATRFINDFYNPDAKDPDNRDRNLIVLGMEIRGPLAGGETEYPESHRRIITARPNEKLDWNRAARQVIEPIANRAFRRPATKRELDRLVKLTHIARERNETFEAGIQLALQAMLVSPHFLFRIELDPRPDDPRAIRDLSEYELATRMSYFLWSSMPDDKLLAHAAKGTLRKNLASEVVRMLKDPKSRALADNFAGQWLQLRALDEMTPDARRFRTFTHDLRSAMRRETLLFFSAIKNEDRSILELLDANFTFLNSDLAQHYGIEGIFTREFRRVDLPKDSPRGGVLTQASILTVTSNPMRTSPVKRGKWIMENILGIPPQPPPPDVPELAEDEKTIDSASMRERLAEHRRNPRCAVCHDQMDPLGLALENYDAIGAWRTRDGKHKVDATGQLTGGAKFDGPVEFKRLLVGKQRDAFVRCFTEKMLTYALGRGVEPPDRCAIDRIIERLSADRFKFSTLIYEIVRSDPFQKRRGTESEAKP